MTVELAERPLVSTDLYDPTFGDLDVTTMKLTDAESVGGGTFHAANLTTPTEGFAVAIPDAELVVSGNAPRSIVRAWLDSVARPCLSKAAQFVGCWKDSTTNKLYLDVVAVVQDADEAIRLAQQYGQLAIFDLLNKREIRI